MEPCHCLLVIFKEGGIGIYLRVAALPDYQVNWPRVEVLMEFRSPCAGNAVYRPEHLLYPLQTDDIIFLQPVLHGKGHMIFRMPVLSGDYLVEARGDPVDGGDYRIAVRNGEGPVGTKIVLHINNKQRLFLHS